MIPQNTLIYSLSHDNYYSYTEFKSANLLIENICAEIYFLYQWV